MAIGAILLICAFSAGYYFGNNSVPDLSIPTLSIDKGETSFAFLHPLLGVQFPQVIGDKKFASMVAKARSIAESQPEESVTRYAFYYKDLDSGFWTGIHVTDQYDPASMLKLVFAVAAYKQQDKHPGFLSSSLEYAPAIAAIQSAFPEALPTNLTAGQSYSVPYLMKDMLTNSDNGAKDLLVTSIDPAVITKIFTDLSIKTPASSNYPGFTISAQDYSRFLRILYYGTYDVDWQKSNQILELLSQSTFTQGLVAGVPKGVPVAHKYGEHLVTTNGKASGIELSDCGIVYHPVAPYLICVMTQGTSVDQLSSFIAALSKMTYDEVNGMSPPLQQQQGS